MDAFELEYDFEHVRARWNPSKKTSR